jgi:hypothetical protein
MWCAPDSGRGDMVGSESMNPRSRWRVGRGLTILVLSLVLGLASVSSAGAEGITGATGATGATGDTGPAGPMGPTGPTGPQGPTGQDGTTGNAGPVGDAGGAGQNGATGPQGPSGPSGPTGTTGPEGGTGQNGTTGSTGPAGGPGSTGPSGPVGTPGTIPTQVVITTGKGQATANCPSNEPVAIAGGANATGGFSYTTPAYGTQPATPGQRPTGWLAKTPTTTAQITVYAICSEN